MLKPATLALLALCFCGVAWSQQAPPTQGPPGQNAQAPAPEQRGTDKAPLTVKILPADDAKEQADKIEQERHEKAAIDERLADDTGRLAKDTNRLANDTDRLAGETQKLVGYTGLLAVFTLALALAAVFQVCLFWVQLRIMRDQLADARIPRVFVRGFHTLEEAGRPSIVFVYVNGGIGPAKIIEIWTDLILAETIRVSPAFQRHEVNNITLRGGENEMFRFEPRNVVEFSFGRGFDAVEVDSLARSFAYLVGSIVYEDSRGRRRETGFCRKNEPGTDRWVIVDNEYEYQD